MKLTFKSKVHIFLLCSLILIPNVKVVHARYDDDMPSITIPTTDEDEDGFSSLKEKEEYKLLITTDQDIGFDTQKENKKERKNCSGYTVKPGDSLSKIAGKLLGSSSRWREIVNANKARYPSLAKNPNLIYPGWTLTIPNSSSNNGQIAQKNNPKTSDVFTTATGSPSEIGAKVANEAMNLVHKYNGYKKFPYAAGTDGGNLGCANVVSTALIAAGVLNNMQLNCDMVMKDLLAVGWKKVEVPPYQEGDVLTWTTNRGPGRHIGIIVKRGNNYQAMSNSSSKRKPNVHNINYRPITKVLRKV